MLKGEKAMLICRSDYAYGDRGSPPKIGPGATLHFEVLLYGIWTLCQLLSISRHLCCCPSVASSSFVCHVGNRNSPTSMLTHLQVELLSWKSNKDLTGNGGIIKTTTREGEGWDHAKNRDEAVGEHRHRPGACVLCCGAPPCSAAAPRCCM